MDPALRQLAGRRLLAALRRIHRRDPLRAEVRLDQLIAEVRADPGERRPPGHRGAGSLRDLTDAGLLGVLDELAASGEIVRSGRRARLAGHEPVIPEREMRERVERLLDGLRAAGASPPRVEGVAVRLGIPRGVVDGLRRTGLLVPVAEGIDYPHDVLDGLVAEMGRLASRGPITIPRVRDGLRTSRRHAEALLQYRRRSQGSRAGETVSRP